MTTYRTWRRIARAGVSMLFFLAMLSEARAGEVLVPESKMDYGSGASSSNFMLYYAGGVPRVGLFVGQANMYARNDRALVKFRIAPYLLSGRPVDSAEVCFEVVSFSGSEAAHKIELSHLLYDANSFSANDMVNSLAEMVGCVSVKSAEFAGSEYRIDADDARVSTTVSLPYRYDVTKYVNNDIAEGNVYSSFRFRNFTAETEGRSDTNPQGVTLKRLRLELR